MVPEPEGRYNSLLPLVPTRNAFAAVFVTERKRQSQDCEALKAINHKLAFVSFDNPTNGGELYIE